MTRRRWIADEVRGDRAFLVGDHARHLAQVLRAKTGQEFDIATGHEVRLGKIVGVIPDRVEFELGEIVTESVPSTITVAISIFKFDRMEWAIEKVTELGVDRIIPVIAARTEKHLAHAVGKRVDRWRRIAAQATEQSRGICPPEISGPTKLNDALVIAAEKNIVLSETEQQLKLKDAVGQGTSSIVLAFGPEGGWTEKEIDLFGGAGWTSASLGPEILRAETAVIAAVAIASALVQR
jgi:16S rRNA (uracil1498-N3)-methyltransferase